MLQILVIDDDILMQMVLKKNLQQQGYDILVASSGKEGIALAQKHLPALIICDWMMPEVSGLEVCLALKADQRLSTTFFILLTARTSVDDKIQALDSGADDFLVKPIDKGELIASVRAGLRIYQLNQDLQTQKQILEAELTEASDYVRSLLRSELTGKVQITTEFIPSRQLGGDCYDFFWLDEDHLVIYLVDTSGHGVGAALHSISILNLMRSASIPERQFYQPAEIMNHLNLAFPMSQKGGRYFTMWYGVWQSSTRILQYASAGHPEVMLLSSGQWHKIPTLDIPLGFFPNMTYQCGQFLVPPQSHLFIYSDGIYEVMLTEGKVWGLASFQQTLQKQPDISSSQILQNLRQLLPQANFNDDVSFLRVNIL